jgi:hypothetical protein
VGHPGCSETKLCFDKCRMEARNLTVSEVSFGVWACGVMAAQFLAKVQVRVRIPPGPFLFELRMSLRDTQEGSQGRVRPSLK